MTDNMKFWNMMARPPITALKNITGGRLKGMSNISPQWRWQIMTETFGIVGIGWKYTVEKRWTNPGADGEHFAFAEILLYVKVDGEWGAPIPGEGGSTLVAKEKNGYYNNDEAFKMAVTDALGTAMAKLGVAADIYLGSFDGSKYKTSPDERWRVEKPLVGLTEERENDVDEKFPVAKVAQELSDGFTPKEYRAKILRIKAVAEASGKTEKAVVVFLAELDKDTKYTVGQVVGLLNGDKNAE